MSKGKRKAKLRDYSRITLSAEESDALRKQLLQLEENPIATAILGAVLVEYELDGLLRRRFRRNDDETWERLVSEQGPLHSLYAKIVAGYAFAIYDKKLRDDLHIVRAIRNAFAHSKKMIDFDDELIVAELLSANSLGKAYGDYLQKEMINRLVAKSAYIFICQEITLKLLRRRHKSTKASYRRVRKKLARSPLGSLFGDATKLDRSTLEYLQRLLPRDHSGDPSPPAPSVSPPVSPDSRAKNDGKKGT
jgi:DNA-binding MltR family transcriptional regulator